MVVFGVTRAPDGATDGEDKKEKNKKNKEKKVKKDVPCLKLSEALGQAPKGARTLAAIVTKMVPGLSFRGVRSWALEYHTSILCFLKGNHYEIKMYIFFSLVT